MTVRSLLLQLGVGGHCKPPAGPGQSPGGGPAGEGPGSSEHYAVYVTKKRVKIAAPTKHNSHY